MEQIEIGKGCPKLPVTIVDGEVKMTSCQKWKCALWRPIQTTMPHPQKKDVTIDAEEWDCVHALNVIVNMDTGRKVNQAGAAIESLRNRMVEIANKSQVKQIGT